MSEFGFSGTFSWDDGDLSVEVQECRVLMTITPKGRRKPCEILLDPADVDRLRHLLRVAADVAESERSDWI